MGKINRNSLIEALLQSPFNGWVKPDGLLSVPVQSGKSVAKADYSHAGLVDALLNGELEPVTQRGGGLNYFKTGGEARSHQETAHILANVARLLWAATVTRSPGEQAPAFVAGPGQDPTSPYFTPDPDSRGLPVPPLVREPEFTKILDGKWADLPQTFETGSPGADLEDRVVSLELRVRRAGY